MRILFANGRNTYPLIRGGDGVSLHYFLSRLADDGHNVLAVGKSDPQALNRSSANTSAELSRLGIIHSVGEGLMSYQLSEHYECRMFQGHRFAASLHALIDSHRPDVILTQLEHSLSVIQAAHQYSLPCLCFIHDTDPENEPIFDLGTRCSAIVFNSEFNYSCFRDRLRTRASIIFPPIDRKAYHAARMTPDCLTFINPIASKGAKIVEELAVRFPSESFLLVPGWQPPDSVWRSLPNVTIAPRTLEMRQVYARTKILLVPSQCPETFGRVAAEAACCGIPSLASKIGGLPEAVGPGGELIADYASTNDWVSALESLLADPSRQHALGLAGQEHSRKFEAEAQYQKLLGILEDLHG